MKVYFVIGTANARKSSLIRALSGIGDAKVFEIALEDGTKLKVWLRASSAQEGKLDVDQLVHSLQTHQSEDEIEAAVIPLWPNDTKHFPGYIEYIQGCADEGWEIAGIVALSTNDNVPDNIVLNGATIPILKIAGTRNTPTNVFASTVRKAWGWI